MGVVKPSVPPSGWNSFDCLGSVATEESILANVEVFRERLAPFGYEYVVLDTGWYGLFERDPGARFAFGRHAPDVLLDEFGRLIPAPVNFPNGLVPIIDRAYEYGLKFGIHIMRGVPRKAVSKRLPVLGTNVTAADIADPESICLWCDYNYGIDMDKPGAQEYYDSYIAMLAEWGVDLIKADDIVPYPREIEAVVKAIESSGREMVLSLSPGGEVRFDDLEAYQKASMSRITKDIWDDRTDLAIGFDRWRLAEKSDAPGFYPDLDMIPFGMLSVWRDADQATDPGEDLLHGKGTKRLSRFTPAQKRTFIAQRAISASPLFMGGYLPDTDEASFELLTHPGVLRCNRSCSMGHRLAKRKSWQLWFAPAREPSASDGIVGWFGVFNTSANPLVCDVPLSLIRRAIASEESWRGGMYDLFGDREIPVHNERFRVELSADDVLFAEVRG